MRKALRLCLMVCGAIAAILFGLWAGGLFRALHLGVMGTVAIILGICVTTLLGAGLMALSFYSDSSDTDREAAQPSLAEPKRRSDA